MALFKTQKVTAELFTVELFEPPHHQHDLERAQNLNKHNVVTCATAKNYFIEN